MIELSFGVVTTDTKEKFDNASGHTFCNVEKVYFEGLPNLSHLEFGDFSFENAEVLDLSSME